MQSPGPARSTEPDTQMCDPRADYYLEIEDYRGAISLHQKFLERHPESAIAHYHLGFAYGLTARHEDELREYQQAVNLGFSNWELFLNLGLLYLERGRGQAAADVLRLATLLAPEHPEPHFNLAMAYKNLARLTEAQQEMLLSLNLNPDQPDAHNNLGVIYAEKGDFKRAREEWSDLVREKPDYQAAHTNLNILAVMEKSGSASRGGFVTAH